jgi:bisphosphoglycerate-independent phosphoglycerate mutase (AlkP superfamily)
VAFAAGGERFLTWEDARRGRALTHDLTGARAAAFGARLPRRTPEEAAEILLGLAAGSDLVLFEFFESDEAGHARSMERALEALSRLDRMLRALVEGLSPGDSLLVASDHGNVEDLSTRNHTLAPVPVLGFGPAADRLGEVRDLTHLAPLLRDLAGAPARRAAAP